MLDLLIIHPRLLWYEDRPQLSNGVLTLTSYLACKGFAVKAIDDNTPYKQYGHADFERVVEQLQPTVIGISVGTLNACNAYALARRLRTCFPNVLIIGGGLHSYDAAAEMIEQPGDLFDVVVKGEAEVPATKLLQAVKSSGGNDGSRALMASAAFLDTLRSIPGLLFKDKQGKVDTGPSELLVNLDELPSVDFNLANISDYIRTPSDGDHVFSQFNFQRGCPFRCAFCKSRGMSSHVRSNSATYMIRDIAARHAKYGTTKFYLYDSNFTLDRTRVREFCSQMVTTGLAERLTIAVQASVTTLLTDEECELLFRAGVKEVYLGVERFDDEFRKIINKAGRGRDAVELMKVLQRHKITTVAFLLFNFPGDTEERLAREARCLDEYMPYINLFFINYLVPLPGTKIYEELENTEGRNWYLREDLVRYRMTYYDTAYLVSGPALTINPFQLPDHTLLTIRRLKEKYHKVSGLRLSSSLLFQTAFRIDLLLGRSSYWLARCSPTVEHIVFLPLKHLRRQVMRRVHSAFIGTKKD